MAGNAADGKAVDTSSRRTVGAGPRPRPPGGESAIAAAWAAGVPGAQRLADGRVLRVVFPGVVGRGPGPDFRSAVLEVSGDTVVGDVEVHCKESAWREHGHAADGRYDGVALHVVGANDHTAATTASLAGRAIPILVLDWRQAALPPFRPPCAGTPPAAVRAVLAQLGWERLLGASARLAFLVETRGPAQALYHATLETLGGPVNRAAFGELAGRLPLVALLERVSDVAENRLRRRVIAAEFRWGASGLAVSGAGLRPAANPYVRLDVAAGLITALWPEGSLPLFPDRFRSPRPSLPSVAGLGRRGRTELMINAVLPVALAAGVPAGRIQAAYRAAGSPGTYGFLKGLESWLSLSDLRPFANAQALQGAIRLHRNYCSKGMCGRCPMTAPAPG